MQESEKCSPPGSSAYGIFQERVLERGAIAFSVRVQGYIIMKFHTWFDADSSPKVLQSKEGQGSPASLFLHTSFLIC